MAASPAETRRFALFAEIAGFSSMARRRPRPTTTCASKSTANTLNTPSIAMRQKIDQPTVERMEQNPLIVAGYLDQRDFQDIAFRELEKAIYENVRRQGTTEPPRSECFSFVRNGRFAWV